MKDSNFIDFTKLPWQLNIAIMGGVFAVFSLIYNDQYIYYGFVTFAYGLLAHVVGRFFEWALFSKEARYSGKHWWIFHVTNFVLFFVWIFVLIRIY